MCLMPLVGEERKTNENCENNQIIIDLLLKQNYNSWCGGLLEKWQTTEEKTRLI